LNEFTKHYLKIIELSLKDLYRAHRNHLSLKPKNYFFGARLKSIARIFLTKSCFYDIFKIRFIIFYHQPSILPRKGTGYVNQLFLLQMPPVGFA